MNLRSAGHMSSPGLLEPQSQGLSLVRAIARAILAKSVVPANYRSLMILIIIKIKHLRGFSVPFLHCCLPLTRLVTMLPPANMVEIWWLGTIILGHFYCILSSCPSVSKG